jgi:DNA-directed RNA polymerase subunit RPC12/RpoP
MKITKEEFETYEAVRNSGVTNMFGNLSRSKKMKVKITTEGYRCLRCKHEWIPRTKKEVRPTTCPKCKSPYWDKERRSNTNEP